MRRATAAVLFIVAPAVTTPALAAGLAPVEVRTAPITAFELGTTNTQFGHLRFLGGLSLSSPNPLFGAWSGLDFSADGRLVSIADTGQWLTARIVETDGKLTGLSDTEMGVMLGLDGKPPADKVSTDAESVRLATSDGKETAFVSFEQTPAVRAYAGPDFSADTPTRLPLPDFVNHLPANRGLEGLAISPANGPLGDTMVLTAERALDASKNHRAFVLSGPMRGTFKIRRSDDYDISDAAFLPNGDLLILERRFSFSGGFGMRIRQIAGSDIRPNATVDGKVLIDAGDHYQIDNMEGLAVTQSPSGETLLTVISDDNHTFLQRTLLLRFAIVP
jgi:hypothetical protein